MPTPRKVLLLGSPNDAQLARETWRETYDYVVCEPGDALSALAGDEHFEFVLSSGLPAQRELESLAGAHFPLIVLLEAEDDSALERVQAGVFVVVRGPAVRLQLVQAARYCAERTARQSFISAVEGPLVHDLRGIVGVVHLSARLLERAGQGLAASSSPASALDACRRIGWWVSDLESHLALRLDPERAWPRVPGTNWHAVIGRRVADLVLDHPRRAISLALDSRPKCTLSPEHVLLVLRGIFEVALRTTGSQEAVYLKLQGDAPEALSLTVSASHSAPSAAIEAALFADPSHWPGGPGSDIPFHLVSASLLARATGGEVRVEWIGQHLQAVARWPASAAHS